MRSEEFIRQVRAKRCNRAIFERWAALDLPDGWLVAGCLLQTDLSETGEQRVQARVDAALADLGVLVETPSCSWPRRAPTGNAGPGSRSNKAVDRASIPILK
jgi:hypothetical protein